jgi:hypothetical protein
MYIKFDETTNLGAEKCQSIIDDGAENINTMNEN